LIRKLEGLQADGARSIISKRFTIDQQKNRILPGVCEEGKGSDILSCTLAFAEVQIAKTGCPVANKHMWGGRALPRGDARDLRYREVLAGKEGPVRKKEGARDSPPNAGEKSGERSLPRRLAPRALAAEQARKKDI